MTECGLERQIQLEQQLDCHPSNFLGRERVGLSIVLKLLLMRFYCYVQMNQICLIQASASLLISIKLENPNMMISL